VQLALHGRGLDAAQARVGGGALLRGAGVRA